MANPNSACGHPPARFMTGDGGVVADLDDCMVCEGSAVKGRACRNP